MLLYSSIDIDNFCTKKIQYLCPPPTQFCFTPLKIVSFFDETKRVYVVNHIEIGPMYPVNHIEPLPNGLSIRCLEQKGTSN